MSDCKVRTEKIRLTADTDRTLKASFMTHLSRGRKVFALAYAILLVACFGTSLIRLLIYSAGTTLHSHILLIPLISGYLLLLNGKDLPKNTTTSASWAIPFFTLGAAAILALGFFSGGLSRNDSLGLVTFSFLCFLYAGGFLVLGREWMRTLAFPAAFLLFMIPLPDSVADWLETASKIASAEVSAFFFNITGIPVFREGLVFQMPGIVLEVAQECSGIRSSWVLFITSLLASYLFLQSAWRRTFLVLFVLPLGVIRNAFRILVIALLCVHIGPEMINSAVHRRGGPLFFALSLIPLFILMWWLRRGDRGHNLNRHRE